VKKEGAPDESRQPIYRLHVLVPTYQQPAGVRLLHLRLRLVAWLCAIHHLIFVPFTFSRLLLLVNSRFTRVTAVVRPSQNGHHSKRPSRRTRSVIMSVVYKDRDEPRTYTTVRRYRVPDRAFEEEDVYEKQIVIKRNHDREATPRQDRDLEYRPRERDAQREVFRYEREVERAPSPPEAHVREFRYEREIEREPPRRDQWDLEKYTRSTDYYQPQPIVIRQEAQPIVIKESVRQPIVLQREEPQYEFIERDEVRDDRQVARRTDTQRRRDDDDYYYERTTREVDRGPRGGGGGEEFRDERDYRRDVNPRDSASNYGDRYSSDDEVIITRRERTGGSRDRSPSRRRHLAEGAIAGLGAAEILRHHRQRQGGDSGHHGRDLLGGAALGAVGAEAISRMRRSRSRSSSASRSHRSSRRERRRRHRSKTRSRSRSRSHTLAKLGTVAAVTALAGYALRNRANKETVVVRNEAPPPRRSRSRRRRSSVGSGPPSLDSRPRSESRHRDPEHRNRRIAQAGLATAAAAGILDRVRSRSRGGKKSRSKSRVRTGVPIAAAGLGGAAMAGLYERNKSRKEAVRDDESERHRSRSRSRERSAPYPEDEPRMRRASSDPNLIVYGDDPIYPDRHYDERPAEYRRRRRGSSGSLSPDRHRHDRSSHSRSRSRSRTRGLAEGAAAAGIAAVAANELGKREERRRGERERRRKLSCLGKDTIQNPNT
jgi:hypothetical protein